MNKRLLHLTAACAALAAGGFQAHADKVPLLQVPNAVQKAIKQQSNWESVQDIERETKDGKVVYEAEFKRDGLNRRVKFAEDGSILPSRDVTAAFDRAPSMALSDLPSAVQKTVREQQAGKMVADIDKETWNGQTVYEIEFKEKGPNSRIHIASDGSLVMNKGEKSGYLGAQLSETPKPVQDTVKRVAGNAEIADVDLERKDGKVFYDVEIRREGLNRHLQIAESGALLHDSGDRGAAGLGERVRDTAERVREKITDRDATSGMAFEQLPATVQATIKANGDVSHLKPIKRAVSNGRVQYDVEFEKDGRNTRLTIGEDGRVVKNSP